MIEMFYQIPPNSIMLHWSALWFKITRNLKSSKIVTGTTLFYQFSNWAYRLRKPLASFCFYLNLAIVILANAFMWTLASTLLISSRALYMQSPQNSEMSPNNFVAKQSSVVFYLLANCIFYFIFFKKSTLNKAGST